MEQYFNDVETTLNGSIINSQTTLVVTAATGYASSGNFRIRIEDELMLVTGVSGTTFTVTRGIESTTAVSHTSGVTVNHVVSAAGLSQILTEAPGVSTPQTATGAPAVAMPVTGWSVINNAKVTDFFNNSIQIHCIDSGSLNWRFYTRTIPSSNYTLYAVVKGITAIPSVNTQTYGVYISDGTKYEGFEIISQNPGPNQLRIEKITNTTTDSATVFGATSDLTSSGTLAVKIVDDGTHRTWYYWIAGGWTQALQETSHTFLTETKAGFGGVSVTNNGLYNTKVELIYWAVV